MLPSVPVNHPLSFWQDWSQFKRFGFFKEQHTQVLTPKEIQHFIIFGSKGSLISYSQPGVEHTIALNS